MLLFFSFLHCLVDLLLLVLIFCSVPFSLKVKTMVPLLPLWILFSLLIALVHARGPAILPSSSPHLDQSNIRPSSLPPASMAAPPSMMQVEVVEHHQRFHKESVGSIVLVSIAVAAIALSAVCALVIWRRRHQNSGSKDIEKSGLISSRMNTINMTVKKGLVAMFDYSVLEAASDNFSETNVLGEGGFGRVYKACLEGGILAAVKKLDGGGQDCKIEFKNELDFLGRMRHPNIVSLLGYCIHGETRFIVYELMLNGSLDDQLHEPSHGSDLNWYARMKIALDTARGLEYLHEHCDPPVIHRDLKSSNILLDSDYTAKISDFGLAVIGGYQNNDPVKLSGTVGYVAPEYILNGKLTEKSDVYAFGVVLLELLMGRRAVEKNAESQCQSIVTWAMPQLTDRSKLPDIVDPVIRNTMDLKHLYQVAAVAVLCVQPEPSYRPLITDVLHSLIPLVPAELGGTLRIADPSPRSRQKSFAN